MVIVGNVWFDFKASYAVSLIGVNGLNMDDESL